MNFSIVFQTVALTYFCIVIKILLRSSSAVEFRTESSFRRHNLTDRFTTDRLLQIHNGIDSTIHCSILCVENPLCVSFFHSPPAAQCRLHSFIVGNVTETTTDSGSVYFVLKRGTVFIVRLEKYMQKNSRTNDVKYTLEKLCNNHRIHVALMSFCGIAIFTKH